MKKEKGARQEKSGSLFVPPQLMRQTTDGNFFQAAERCLLRSLAGARFQHTPCARSAHIKLDGHAGAEAACAPSRAQARCTSSVSAFSRLASRFAAYFLAIR